MKFEPGQQFKHDGVWYRILPGNRCSGDMIIEFSLDGIKWHRPSISHSEILISFKYQVEENNYGAEGKVTPGRGGQYLLESVRRACQKGWNVEAERIANEVQWKKTQIVLAQMGLPI